MSSGFITETEALEARRKRQEEWDKVRKEDQPIEAPEEVYDTRPLYTRLEEQRLKKEAEYEEAHKLKNMIRGLDDDEVGFLDMVEETKAKVAQQISIEEQKEMREFRERVSKERESEEMMRLRAQLAPAAPVKRNNSKPSIKNQLQGIVVRKRKVSETENLNGVVHKRNSVSDDAEKRTSQSTGALQCVAVLPGLGHYSNSSSESDSSESEEERCHGKRDFLGRIDDDKKKEDKS